MASLNFTNETCFYNLTEKETLDYLYKPFGKYFILVIVPLISSFGLFGNLSFLYVVFRTPHLQNITNFYLGSLAIADALLLFSGGVQYLWSYTRSYGLDFDAAFIFGSPVSCSTPNFLVYLCYFASVFLVTFVTMERYSAICHSLSYRVSKRRAIIFIAVAWIVSLILTGFQIPFSEVRIVCVSWPPEEDVFNGFPDQIPVCFHACDWCLYLTVWADFIQYIIAVPAVSFMSLSMARGMRRSLKLTKRMSIRSTSSIRARQNLVMMVQINALVFFLCLTPYEIMNLNEILGKSEFLTTEQAHYLKWVGRITMLVNAAVNPLIYSIVNPVYRQAFIHACCCCCYGHDGSCKCRTTATSTHPTKNQQRYEMVDKIEAGNGIQTPNKIE